MPSSLSQFDRNAELKTPLGPDVLGAVSFDGTEGLSELFEYTVDAVSDDRTINFDSVIGKSCAVVLESKTGTPRQFSGIATRVTWLGLVDKRNLYRLTLQPWLWLLSRTSNCKIFHNKDVPTIIREVFTARGFSDFDFRLGGSYAKREYTVQYRETDLDFVLRLMEEEGIYYFFQHMDEKHQLILADARSSHRPLVEAPQVMFQPRVVSGRSELETIYELSSARRFQFGKVTLNDYDYLKPSARMTADYEHKPGHAVNALEIYDYPGRYTERGVGDQLARVILQAEQAPDKRRHAIGDVVHMVPGGLTSLTRHPVPSENIQYIIVRCVHTFSAQGYRSSPTLEAGETYGGSYELQPSDIPFRAPRVTRRPLVFGPQTAKVVGEPGEEIDVDKYGRILVRFHWDRDAAQSRRVRVAQTWAGKQWGTMIIPRIGQEVVVEFLEGNPDQPIVTGCVYNAEMMPPYDLPAGKNKGGLKSNSTKGGGGYNEIAFDDTKGAEVIDVHAQNELLVTALGYEQHDVGAGRKQGASGAARATKIENGDDTLKLTTGDHKTEIEKGNQTIDVKLGSQTVHAGKKITIEADVEIELKVGKSTIKLTQGSIKLDTVGFLTLSATRIDLN